MMREKESFHTSLQASNSSLAEEKQKYEGEISRLYNQTNVLREEIERLKFVIVERESSILSLRTSL